MFPGSVIRKLAHSEEFFAQYQTFTSFTVQVGAPVDVDALSDAFDALLEAHPVFTAHLEQGPDGNHSIVADDLLHPGIWVVDGSNGTPIEDPGVRLDQSVSLFNLRLMPCDGGTRLTAYVHHSLADGHHIAALLGELFLRYTAVVATGDPGPVIPEPAPKAVEVVLQERGIEQRGRSGLERFLPVMFAYDLPAAPQPPVTPSTASPQAVPANRCRLTEQETADLEQFSRDNGLSLNAVLAAAILLAEWQLRDTPHIPIPYLYSVDLRYLLSPPVGATEGTNPLGVATYLAEIEPYTDIVELATDIVETLRADLADGLIQQSVFHSGMEFRGTPPGLPPAVCCTNVSSLPSLPMPEGVELEDFYSEVYCSIDIPIDFYACSIAAGRLSIEHHGAKEASGESVEAVRSLLCSIPSEYGWVME
ncbi:phthiocerol/phthiodiolone dimycocerosyl transferase [Mycobacterium spongiae]|uniref:Phthiocerol/phthiodiolone dimycocerosyl transferase n=1 Tax=Mycobacterium spongiae TaxID=886343 RepID=A0A975JWC5_9MYCO|nr:phthiocerol/phthiodiolone dimycocerosyl transferase [Mycobacterium spongiae]QUR66891.1 phthiocerol/phthiodiolone dimycocerosyl transferase [Mycobacterium spongiae]